jgi:hypothetical protein
LNVLAELVCCVEATRHFSSEAESAESPWSDLTTLPLWIHETMHHLRLDCSKVLELPSGYVKIAIENGH